MKTPGCVLSTNGEYYLPLVFVAHDKLYFGTERCDTAWRAIYVAARAIKQEEAGKSSYSTWHSHEFTDIK